MPSNEQIEKEKQKLVRIVISNEDIREAKKFCEILIEKFKQDNSGVNDIIKEALSISAIIAYTRPFSHNDKNKQGTSKSLGRKYLDNFNDEEKELHQKLINFRNSMYAHSDSDVHGVKLSMHYKQDSKIIIPVKWKANKRIHLQEVKKLLEIIRKVDFKLSEEQVRIQEILPKNVQF